MNLKNFYNIFFLLFCFGFVVLDIINFGFRKFTITIHFLIPTAYILPSIVAVYIRKHENSLSILVLNLFLGWTIVGWIAAFIWGTYNSQPKNINANIKINKGENNP